MPRRNSSPEERIRGARRRYDYALDALESSTTESEIADALVGIGGALNELLAVVRANRRRRGESDRARAS